MYPLCPGVAAGRFDPDRHALLAFTPDEVAADLRAFAASVREVNPRMRMIVTVSPVPLAATARPQHVLAATTLAKAVLRVAAEQAAALPGTYYFPAYEIVQAGGLDYFAADRRSVTEEGVRRVMALFFAHLMEAPPMPAAVPAADDTLAASRRVVDALCDEQRLDAPPADAEGLPGA